MVAHIHDRQCAFVAYRLASCCFKSRIAALVLRLTNFYTAGDRTSRLRYFRRGIEPSPGRSYKL
ncbi:hypothetical protein [Microcoleus sp. B3-D7]|uniref:hypothetical protein n=1 Tax=Microcoleus sp. B3-D7 TaxID=2818659 RepID=UPI002FD570A8